MKDCSEKLFDLVDSFAENAKRKAAVWPLQIILLILSPDVLQDISKEVVEESKVNKFNNIIPIAGKSSYGEKNRRMGLRIILVVMKWQSRFIGLNGLILLKLFLDNLKKALAGHGGSRQLTESAAIACVKLCKASTYISWEDNSVICFQVQSMVVDLK
eukprot:g42365.t1